MICSIIALACCIHLAQVHDKFADFRAFYCAGEAIRVGADPYLEHPLHECERSVSMLGLPNRQRDFTMPAPFPGFVLAVFRIMACFPFTVAFIGWTLAACAALGISIVFVARTTQTPILANLVALGFPAAIVVLPLGQVTPFILLALATSAVCVVACRPRCAALAALGALLDPHVGIALCLGLFVGFRSARGVLIAGAILLAGVGLLSSGPRLELEYYRLVVPAHALANVSDATQFSATNWAFLAGLQPAKAVAIGSLWYLGALLLGLVVAWRLHHRAGPATWVYIPIAFVVFGGAHTHFQQLALAIPAFMFARSAGLWARADLAALLTFVAATPWLFFGAQPWVFFAPSVLALFFAHEMKCARWSFGLAMATLATQWLILLTILQTFSVHKLLPVVVEGNPLAEVSWQAATIAENVPAEVWLIVAKAPTVLAFTLFFAVVVRTAFRTAPLVREC